MISPLTTPEVKTPELLAITQPPTLRTVALTVAVANTFAVSKVFATNKLLETLLKVKPAEAFATPESLN